MNETPASASEENTVPDSTWYIILLLIGLLSGLFGYYFLNEVGGSDRSKSELIGYLVGYCFGPALVPWGFFRMSFSRRATRKRNGAAYLAIYTALTVGAGFGALNTRAQIRAAASEFLGVIEEGLDQRYAGHPIAESSSNRNQPHSVADEASVFRILQAFWAKNAKQQREIFQANDRALREAGWHAILMRSNFPCPKRLGETKEKLSAIKLIIGKQNELRKQAWQRIVSDIAMLDLDADMKRTVGAGFQAAQTGPERQLEDKYWELEEELVNHHEAVIALLESTSVWFCLTQDIVIEDGRSETAYNKILRDIDAAIHRQDAVVEDRQTLDRNRLESMRRSLER